MRFTLPLHRIGAYALDEIEKAVALASAEAPEASGGGPIVKLRTAEITVVFATADGSDASPATIVVSEAPLPAATLRPLLEPLDYRVLVARADVESAPPASLGRLVLRVMF
jgi:hypothetical protein